MPWDAEELATDIIDRRSLLARDCPALGSAGFLEVGLTHVGPRWRMIRPAPAFGLALVTQAGAGSVLVGDRWQSCPPETAYLMPPGVLHGYTTGAGGGWRYAWIRLVAATAPAWLFRQPQAVLRPAASYSLAASVSGLLEEARREADAHRLSLWTALGMASLRQLAGSPAMDPRLEALWATVAARLGEPWDLERLAEASHLSREHLRRLCRRDLGRSPHGHLAALRLGRAAELLATTDLPLRAIADQVGYCDAFAFSQAFTRAHRQAPSRFRLAARRPEAAATLI